MDPDQEGHFSVVLGGSFEPLKVFTIGVYVREPAVGQTLKLELPPGMERLEGKDIEPVPAAEGEIMESYVLWKARVLQLGKFPVRIRSSTGLTQTKIVMSFHAMRRNTKNTASTTKYAIATGRISTSTPVNAPVAGSCRPSNASMKTAKSTAVKSVSVRILFAT